MKYTSISNNLNVSSSRNPSFSPSLQIDNRGFPHISWLSNGNDSNIVNYSYWDGLKWSYYDIPKIDVSNESIVFSPNALVLDTLDSPMIVFSKKIGTGFRLSLATYDTEWSFSNYDVAYEVGWIGIVRYDGFVGGGSISSGSSSSSSYSHSIYFVVAHDTTNDQFVTYSVDSGTWTWFASRNVTIDNFESIRIDVCGNRLGIACVYDQDIIRYNFLDMNSSAWSFVDFQDYNTLYGNIIDMDMGGYYQGLDSIMAFGWISRTITDSYVCSVLIQDDGTVTPSNNVSPVVENQDIWVTASSDYIVNGYRKIAICIDDQDLIRIIALGSSPKEFQLTVVGANRVWTTDLVDIEGISNGIVPTYARSKYSSDVKLVIAADSGDIYYFEQDSGTEFPVSNPDMVLLNDLWAYRAYYFDGKLSGTSLSGTYANIAGDILRDSERPLFITSNPGIPPTTTTTTLPPSPWTWTARDSNRFWWSVTSSSDGSKLAAVVQGGKIYTSTDYGVNWIPRDSNRSWYGIASSFDGSKLVAADYGGYLYTSTDYGVTWIPRDNIRNWVCVASSSNGKYLVASGDNLIYTSTDYGATWTPQGPPCVWLSVASSSDGSKLVACADYLYTSTDYGVTWIPRDSIRTWWDIASSSDGSKLVAGVSSGYLYTSSDYGTTWTPHGISVQSWEAVTSSADGTKLAAVQWGGQIYYSEDSGTTWNPTESSRVWESIASSDDGTKLVAVVTGGQIYTGVHV